MKKLIILFPLLLISTQEIICSRNQTSQKARDIIKIAATPTEKEKAPRLNSDLYHEWPGSSASVHSLQTIKEEEQLPTISSSVEFP